MEAELQDPCKCVLPDSQTAHYAAAPRSFYGYSDSNRSNGDRLPLTARSRAHAGVAEDHDASSGGDQNLFLYNVLPRDLAFSDLTIGLQDQCHCLLQIFARFLKG